jgi:hypothetical protein
MPTNKTAQRRSGQRQTTSVRSRRPTAIPGRARKQAESRPASFAARVRPKRSRKEESNSGLLPGVRKALTGLTSTLTGAVSRSGGKKRAAALLTAAAGALAATAAFIRRGGRQHEEEAPPAAEAPAAAEARAVAEAPAAESPPQAAATTTDAQEADGGPAGDATSSPPA